MGRKEKRTNEIYVIYRLHFRNNSSAESKERMSERSEWKYEFCARARTSPTKEQREQ